MKNIAGRLIFSATDLSHFLACPQLSLLDRRAVITGPRAPRYDDPALEVLWQRGIEHERSYLERQRAAGLRIIEVVELDHTLPYEQRWTLHTAATLDAMRTGADVIYQAALFDGTWLGRTDFLERVEIPSHLGAWSYEVVDTKLARTAKGGALLQVLLYAELLAEVQGIAPARVHIELGGPEPRRETFRVAEYAAYFRSVRRRFLELMRDLSHSVQPAAEPVEHCHICAWSGTCAADRRTVDHLSLVAGISLQQRRGLQQHDIATLESLGTHDGSAIAGIGSAGLGRIHGQARIQLQGRRERAPLHELLLPVTPRHGLAALPAPSAGDLFFDIEGDPFALTHGIEYLFGFSDRTGVYTGWWALDRESERRVFERFIDYVVQRRAQHPDMHVYHYNHYETTALKRLMGRFGTRERELDALLRADTFVDLYRVVRQGLRASVESYSIKKLEPYYGFTRAVDLRSASSALAHFEAFLELGGDRDDELLQRIEGYNRDDCLSTWRLAEWLEQLRAGLARTTDVPRPEPSADDVTEDAAARDADIDALVARLIADVPDDESQRTRVQHGRWLNGQLLEFHRREKKAFWWEYFRCMDLNGDELVEDRATLGGLTYDGEAGTVVRSVLHRYRFPPQDHGIRAGDTPHDPETGAGAGKVEVIDDVTGTIVLRRGRSNLAPRPNALVPHDHVNDTPQRESLLRLGEETAEHGLTAAHPRRCAVDLLLRNPPRARQPHGASLMAPGETPLAAAVRLVEQLEHTVLPIQGPPGAGKTYTAARMIVRAIELGMRVGVTAQSHKVIGNLIEEVCRAAVEAGVAFTGVQKADESQWCGVPHIARSDDYAELRALIDSDNVQLVAGTAWLWSRADMTAAVDMLVIDEAGQFSLANALAVAPAAGSLVLVGDPQQLEQPIQGTHPPGVHVSALEHLVGGHTVAPDRGLFLDRTWRLHPTICAFTSELFYDGRLQPRDGLERQAIHGGPLSGSGLRFVPVQHHGNQSESVEEAEAIARIVEDMLAGTAAYTDASGARRTVGIRDILIVAPYNAQVAALAARLPADARVGTVDRFQGQEAPVVIYSMTTSSAADAPRGMSFLFSPNRLNVATSRARCLAVVVASPLLFVPECRTPDQMRLANAFCRFAELGAVVPIVDRAVMTTTGAD